MAIKAGLHDGRILPFIQQESTFWTKELWEKSKGMDVVPLYLMNS